MTTTPTTPDAGLTFDVAEATDLLVGFVRANPELPAITSMHVSIGYPGRWEITPGDPYALPTVRNVAVWANAHNTTVAIDKSMVDVLSTRIPLRDGQPPVRVGTYMQADQVRNLLLLLDEYDMHVGDPRQVYPPPGKPIEVPAAKFLALYQYGQDEAAKLSGSRAAQALFPQARRAAERLAAQAAEAGLADQS